MSQDLAGWSWKAAKTEDGEYAVSARGDTTRLALVFRTPPDPRAQEELVEALEAWASGNRDSHERRHVRP